MSRGYELTPEARQQRSEAAKARWAAMSKPERVEALRPAFEHPLNGRPPRKRRHSLRDALGRFVRQSQQV